MSSDETPSSTTPPPPPPPPHHHQLQSYFCYPCNRTISIPPPNSGELSCPHCNGGFLEEVEPPPPSLSLPFPFPSDFVDPIDLSSLFPRPSPALGGPPSAGVFDPFHFLHTYLHSMRQGGTNIQFVIENANGGAGSGLSGPGLGGANLGDYFFGPGLEQLIHQLAENDPNRYGTPPASKAAVEGLKSVHVNEEVLNSDVDAAQCAVCMDEFELGAEAKQMPCNHVFHKDCILPWLELHNSCPVCRYELPTDDPEYEQRQRAGGGGGFDGSGGGGVVEGGSEGDRMVERRFRISLPWPLGASQGEGSNAASGDGENRNFGAETRQEDLD